MPDVTDEIDEMVRAAAKAHEGLAGADYFDGLSARVLARLESRQDEVSMMSDTTKDADDGEGLAGEGRTSASGAPGPSEDSGLHDMKALAHTAKMRIRRTTSQHDAYDDSLLSSSTSGLRAVALPVQAQVVALPDMPRTAAAADIEARGDAAEAAGVTPIHAATAKRSKAIWFIGGGVLAAAAAVAIIVGGAGGKKDAASDQQVAAGAPAQGTASATAAAAPPAATGEMTQPAVAAGTGAPAPADVDMAAKQEVALDKQQGADRGGAAATGDRREQRTDKGAAGAKAESGKPDASGGGGAAAGAGAGSAKRGGTDKAAAGGDKPGGKPGGGGGAPAGGGDQSIEDLLNQASGGAQKPSEGGSGGGGEVKPEKTGLDGKDIKAGMSSVKGKAQACYDAHGVAGHVKIKATVDPSGKVLKADVTGEFAGTPTGQCVADAVKTATFATWTGAPMTVSYGFTLVE